MVCNATDGRTGRSPTSEASCTGRMPGNISSGESERASGLRGKRMLRPTIPNPQPKTANPDSTIRTKGYYRPFKKIRGTVLAARPRTSSRSRGASDPVVRFRDRG